MLAIQCTCQSHPLIEHLIFLNYAIFPFLRGDVRELDGVIASSKGACDSIHPGYHLLLGMQSFVMVDNGEHIKAEKQAMSSLEEDEVRALL